jgi:hypothetical protein
MNLEEFSPPRLEEGYEAKPTKQEDNFGDTISKMSSGAFAEAWQKATNAGLIDVEAGDPRILTAFKQANKYLADMASAGLSTAEGIGGVIAGAIGEVFGGSPEGEVRLARDIYSMGEAFAGKGIARGANLLDDLVDSGAATAMKVAERANQPGPMPEVLGSNFGNLAAPKTSYKPSMFRRVEEAIPVSGNFEVATFYSPTVETLRNTDFPSKGMTGGELLKLLQDKTPGVRKAELEALGLNIDKSKRYTKDDILNLAESRSYRVTAQVESRNQFEGTQRQKVADREVGYDELKINAVPNDASNPSFLPSRGYTHYDPETIAHTRLSIRESVKDGTEYALVEEIQSDLLQKGFIKPRGEISLDEAYKEVLDFTSKDILDNIPKAKPLYDANPEYFQGWFKLAAEQNRSTPGLDVEKLAENLRQGPSIEELAEKSGVGLAWARGLLNAFEEAGWQEGVRIERRMKAVGPSPITEDSDAVRLSLQAALAKADDAEVSSLVIPNVQRIAAERAKPGTEEFENFVKANSGFTRTYVKGVEKFIKQLQDEFGNAIKVEQIDLPYQTRSELPMSAIKIDFSELRKRRDVDFRVGRFAEGGMVEMKKLFQEGGMADDGMTREPVTGNEIPPGSLAEEVRDDIPARLSEGEYVVPADVVRFFGVKFFEDLRMQAKEGLSEMDKDGRIGGEPVEEELTPEEEQMLREALGGGELQMAEGGVVDGFDRTQFKVGATSGFETRRYINPKTKEERNVAFINGMPLGKIPDGFIPWTEEAAKVEEVKPSQNAPTVDRGGEGMDQMDNSGFGKAGGGYADWAKENYSAITSDPFGFGMNALSGGPQKSTLGSVGTTIAGAISPVLGALAGAVASKPHFDAVSDARVALSQLDPNSSQYKELSDAIDAFIDKMPGMAGTAAKNNIIASGTQKSKALTQYKETGGSGYDYSKDISAGTKAVTEGFAPPPSRPDSFSSIDTSKSTSGSTSGTTSSGTTSSANAAPGSTSTPSSSGYYSSYGGGKAEGGLMMKPKKAKAKSKGLGGKQ